MIVELDIVGMSPSGETIHLGTFKCEVKDDFFGPTYNGRVTYSFVDAWIGNGRIQVRPYTRPKNKPVQEDNE